MKTHTSLRPILIWLFCCTIILVMLYIAVFPGSFPVFISDIGAGVDGVKMLLGK